MNTSLINTQKHKQGKFMSTSSLRDRTSASKQLFHALTVAAVLLAAGTARAATTVISDGTFAPANWSLLIGPATTPGVTASNNQVTSGGDPGSYEAVNYASPPGSDSWALSMLTYYTGGSYRPKSMGPVSSISFSADLINLTDRNVVFFGLFQDGNAYLLNVPLTLTSSWTGFSASGTALNDSFSADNGTHPNLVNGDAIGFGIITSMNVGGVLPSGSFGFDNFQATITYTPEPRIWELAILGLLAIALSNWMNRRGTKAEIR